MRRIQLRIADTGVKSWHWRFLTGMASARDQCLAYGNLRPAWPDTKKAEAARTLLRRGIDPRRAGITIARRVKAERPASSGPLGHSVEQLAREFRRPQVTSSASVAAPNMCSAS